MSDFTDYVQGYVGNVSGTLAWRQDTLDFIVAETLDLYGVSTEAEATDTTKAKAILRFKTMERILMDYSTSHDYAADGESFSLNQVPTRFMEMWKLAKRDVQPYLPNTKITVQALDTGFSPTRRSRS